MLQLPDLPPEFHWVSQETHKAIFAHTATGKCYGVRSFSQEGLGEGVRSEIAYGIAKIAREIQRDAEFNSGK